MSVLAMIWYGRHNVLISAFAVRVSSEYVAENIEIKLIDNIEIKLTDIRIQKIVGFFIVKQKQKLRILMQIEGGMNTNCVVTLLFR